MAGSLGFVGTTAEAKAGVNISFGFGLPFFVQSYPRYGYVEPCERYYYQPRVVYYAAPDYYGRHRGWHEEHHCR